MTNNNYLRGRRFERELVNQARKKGLISGRTAGSKSKIDLFIIDPKNNLIEMIQCKTGKSFMSQKDMLDFEGLSGKYEVWFKVVRKERKVR